MKKLLNKIKNIFALYVAKKEAIEQLCTYASGETYEKAEQTSVDRYVEEYTRKIKQSRNIEEIDEVSLNAVELIGEILSIEKKHIIKELKAKLGGKR
ncbi:MAG: hypothetical protein R3Y18_00095 [Bacillota bacterium]